MYTTEIFWSFFQEYPTLVICNIIISIVYPIQDIGLPMLYGYVIDSVTEGGHRGMIKPFAYVAGMLIFIQLTHVVSDLQDAKFSPTLRNWISKDMVTKIFDVYETQFKELNAGELISQIVKIPYHLSGFAERIKSGIIPHMLTFLIANIYFFYHDKTLGIGLLIMVATFSYSCLNAPFACEKISIEAADDSNELNEQIDDSLRNLISIYSQDQKQQEIDRLKPYEKKYEDSYEKSMKCSINTRLWVLPIILTFLLVFIYRCYTNIKNKKMKIATFVSLFIMLLYVLDCMLLLTEQISDMIFDWGVICGFDEFFEFTNTPNEIYQNMQTQNYDILDKGITLRNISFTYNGANKPILDNFNLNIKKGERIGILGEIGSGKSTVEKLILKLNIPNSGSIYLDGVDYNNITVKEIRKRIGYVPQNPLLFNRTVLENIRYGNNDVTEHDINKLIDDLHLRDEFLKLENGLMTKSGSRGGSLSGGQRQLCTIMRILLSNPEILVLDEPTSNLDEKSKKMMEKLFDLIMKDKTVIIVTHDDTLMKYCDRTIYMKNGIITKDTNNRQYLY